MNARAISLLLFLLPALLHAQVLFRGMNGLAGTTPGQYPVTPPSGATVYSNLEQNSGWSGDSTLSVSGAYAPMVCEISPTGNGNPCPGAGTTAGGTYSGGGGGSTLQLISTGVSGSPAPGPEYSGWMAKIGQSLPAGITNMLEDVTYIFSGVSSPNPIQAMEFGNRYTNASQITNNGQTQLVPIPSGNSPTQQELDLVPSTTTGGWADTSCRLPLFVPGVTYNIENYYQMTTSNTTSLIYEWFTSSAGDNTLCTIPSSYGGVSLQNIPGTTESPAWSANETVVAFQPDINKNAGSFTVQVKAKLTVW